MPSQMELLGPDHKFIVPELLGRRLAFYRHWMIDYTHSYYAVGGELCHAGTLCGRGRDNSIRLGSVWGWVADGDDALVVL